MIYLALYIYAFYLLFVVTMAAKAAWKNLSVPVRVLLIPAGIVAVLMDVCFNLASTIIFLDWPREFMFTQRLNRYIVDGGWRSRLALCICRNLLDPFQIGGHCK